MGFEVLLPLKIIVFVLSVVIHEVMHGLVALKFGDHTAERAGRLTLNPLPHIDPFATVLFPLLMALSGGPILGGAKPVPVNPLNFTNIKQGEFWVSVAGILSNLTLAIIGAVLYHLLPLSPLSPLLSFLATINLFLAFFNLIPIPPLDGSKVVMALLPYQWARKYAQLEPYGLFIILALLVFPIGGIHVLSLLTIPLIVIISSVLQVPLTFF